MSAPGALGAAKRLLPSVMISGNGIIRPVRRGDHPATAASPIPRDSARVATGELPEPIVRALGVIDLAGGLGVVLPMATGIRPRLTVVAALGCVALQVCALIFHVSRDEISAAPANVAFLGMAVFIAWGRRGLGRHPASSARRSA